MDITTLTIGRRAAGFLGGAAIVVAGVQGLTGPAAAAGATATSTTSSTSCVTVVESLQASASKLPAPSCAARIDSSTTAPMANGLGAARSFEAAEAAGQMRTLGVPTRQAGQAGAPIGRHASSTALAMGDLG